MIASTTKFVPPAKSGELVSTILLKLVVEKLTGKLVELETESDGKEEQLVGDGDQQRYCQIVIVQGMDFRHDDGVVVGIKGARCALYKLSSSAE